MPDTKISDLPLVSSVAGTEELPLSDGTSTTKAATAAQLRTYNFASPLPAPVQTTTPTAPGSGVVLYSKNYGGRTLATMTCPTGPEIALQPSFFTSQTVIWLPTVGTTIAASIGTVWQSRNSGTSAIQSHPSRVSTSFVSQSLRASFSTGTTTTGTAGIQSGAPIAWRGNAANLGGFFFHARFATETIQSTTQLLVGLAPLSGNLTGNPSAVVNCVCVGADSGDTNLQIMTVNNSGTSTKTDLGVSKTVANMYDVFFFCPPNSSSIIARVENAGTGTVYADNISLTTNLPANTSFLNAQCLVRSTASTTAQTVSLCRIYIAADR